MDGRALSPRGCASTWTTPPCRTTSIRRWWRGLDYYTAHGVRVRERRARLAERDRPAAAATTLLIEQLGGQPTPGGRLGGPGSSGCCSRSSEEAERPADRGVRRDRRRRLGAMRSSSCTGLRAAGCQRRTWSRAGRSLKGQAQAGRAPWGADVVRNRRGPTRSGSAPPGSEEEVPDVDGWRFAAIEKRGGSRRNENARPQPNR